MTRSNTTEFDSERDLEIWYENGDAASDGHADEQPTDVGTEASYSATTVFASDDEDADKTSDWDSEYFDRLDGNAICTNPGSKNRVTRCTDWDKDNVFPLELCCCPITAGSSSTSIAATNNAVEPRDPKLVNAFNELRMWIGFGEIMLEWWEQQFEIVRIGAIYGDRFWEGFLLLFREYLASPKLCLQPAENFDAAYFQKPACYSRGAASRPLGKDNPADPHENSFYPCYCMRYEDDFYIMICIRTVIAGNSKPWIVHSSWISWWF